ncbi:MAG: methyl-accepting chemotaxis protein [Treponema sp.]|jgi:methyl-accepting chemotaxis protein|nr:methyl-accepting chemotaxis protein [Treponema sp.]
MSTNTLNSHVQNQSSNDAMVFPAIEQTEADTNSVTGILIDNSVNEKTLKESSGESMSEVQEAPGEADGLSKINALVENIASQTNQLSTDAAVEAFQVGETRKSFAILANNIRTFTESSNALSSTIDDALKNMRVSIDIITRSAKAVLAKFDTADSSVGIVAKEEMPEKSNCPEKSTQELAGNVDAVSAGVEHLNVIVRNINELRGKTDESVATLAREASRFKV